jgi:hypothetical protein
MTKGISIALIAVGGVLMVLGLRAADSLSSDVSRFFTDSPTDKAIWMLIGGGAALIVGLAGVARGGQRAS